MGGGVLWEVIRSWGWPEPWWVNRITGQRACLLFLHCEDGMRNGQSAPWKRVLTRNWPCWHPDLRLPTSGTMRHRVISHSVCRTWLQQGELRQACSDAPLQWQASLWQSCFLLLRPTGDHCEQSLPTLLRWPEVTASTGSFCCVTSSAFESC